MLFFEVADAFSLTSMARNRFFGYELERIREYDLKLNAGRTQYHEIVDFTKLGVDPKAAKILVVKSGYLEPQIKAIANPNLMALTNGSINQDIVHLPKNKYRPPTFPFVDDFDLHAQRLHFDTQPKVATRTWVARCSPMLEYMAGSRGCHVARPST
jgi:hypothetical protein